MKQYEQVIETMRNNGGYATLGELNRLVDISNWRTNTPFASIRRIVQMEPYFFKIRPGLWALTECKNTVLEKFQIQDLSKKENIERFTHSYYQGLLLEIGNMKGYRTYFPAQDENKMYLEKPLHKIASDEMLDFSYPYLVSRAKTIDVIWFNERKMPYAFFEIEHSTNIYNSLLKFCQLQDFYSKFYIIADKKRKEEFDRKYLSSVAFSDMRREKRVKFRDYEYISDLHTKTTELLTLGDL
jgi:hypothetical protein